MGDFGRKQTSAPQRTTGFFQNVTDRVKDNLNMADKKLNQIFFPTGDYIKPIGKGGMSHVSRPVAAPQVIRPAIKEPPKPSSQLVVSNGTITSTQAAKTPMSPVAIAGIAAAVVGIGFFFLKD